MKVICKEKNCDYYYQCFHAKSHDLCKTPCNISKKICENSSDIRKKKLKQIENKLSKIY